MMTFINRADFRIIQVCIILVVLMLSAALSFGAVVKDTKSSQVGNRMLFEYDFSGETGEEGKVGISITVGGQTYTADNLHLEGDFGKIKVGKGKKLWWNVLQDFPKGIADELYIDIHADFVTEKDIAKINRMQEIQAAVDSINPVPRN